MKKNIYLLRHADSMYNAKQTTNLNSVLTYYGKKQCQSLGLRLKDTISSNICYLVSPYKRTRETYHILSQYINGDVICGTDKLGEHRHPSAGYNEFTKLELGSVNEKIKFFVAGLETDEEFLKRMKWSYDFIKNLLKNYESVIVVTHGMCCLGRSNIFNNIERMPVWEYNSPGKFIKNGEYIYIEG